MSLIKLARAATLVSLLVTLLLPGLLVAQDGNTTAAVPDYSRKGADTCFACHDDAATLEVFNSKHAVPGDNDTPFGHGQLQCEACHGPGDAHAGRVRRGEERPAMPAFDSNTALSIAEQNGFCADCHDNDLGFAWHGGAHDINTVSCAGCHNSHSASDPVAVASTQAEVCFDCHQQQKTQSMKPYAHPVRQGEMACGSCHNTHGQSTESLLARQTPNDTCYDCHAETRGPYLWEHAPVAEDCGNCHDPHGSTQPGMLTARAPLLCQGCHAQDGHPSLPQDARGLPDGMPSQFLLGQSCMNCHSEVHGSNHPSGSKLMR